MLHVFFFAKPRVQLHGGKQAVGGKAGSPRSWKYLCFLIDYGRLPGTDCRLIWLQEER